MVMLLSSMVALSACLPKVTGRYGSKYYSPHLFFFLLAEAASGKGEMEFAAKPLNKLEERFQQRYEEDFVKYSSEHNRWLFNKEAAFKEHKDFDTPEPKEPKQVELKIPANISKSMVLHHLDQNGEVGCAMFDAEANSLTNANKQECGNFMSDLKRHGLITLRLAMILAALRKAETKSEESLIYCSDIDFPIAMEITSCCIEHSFILSTTLPDEQTGMLKARNPKPMMELFNNLPNPFTLKEALEVAETLHIKKRTLYVYLKKAERKMIEKIAPGYYKKL